MSDVMPSVGDVVRRTSDSRLMTVEAIDWSMGEVRCAWFEGDDLKREAVRADDLDPDRWERTAATERTYRVAEGDKFVTTWFNTEQEARASAEVFARSKPGTRYQVTCDVASVIAEPQPALVEWRDG